MLGSDELSLDIRGIVQNVIFASKMQHTQPHLHPDPTHSPSMTDHHRLVHLTEVSATDFPAAND
ncbi:hypothetical protein [Allocoleopsis sp.]|uniref:hypothetical protein n=1 Tax=Allocoleopsis sp. TaxID=3088169 RepID=UPI002FD05FE4